MKSIKRKVKTQADQNRTIREEDRTSDSNCIRQCQDRFLVIRRTTEESFRRGRKEGDGSDLESIEKDQESGGQESYDTTHTQRINRQTKREDIIQFDAEDVLQIMNRHVIQDGEVKKKIIDLSGKIILTNSRALSRRKR